MLKAYYKWRLNRLKAYLSAQEVKVAELKDADANYSNSYYTDRYLKASEDLWAMKAEIKLLEDRLSG